MREARNFIDGRWEDGACVEPLVDKYDDHIVGAVYQPSFDRLDYAMARLADSFERRTWTPYERFEALTRAAELIAERSEAFVDTVVTDTGFTVGDAQRETSRAAETLQLCAEEAKRITGEMVPMDGASTFTGRLAFTVRHPLGIVCAITPFNSPLNTVCHKVGPALAAGNALILKPSGLTPLTACLLFETLLDAGVPPSHLALVHGSGAEVGQWLLEDPRPAFYAFTGSTAVGARIRSTIGLRRAQLELGSLSSTIVCQDADVENAVKLCINAAFRKAGQVCTSIQRLYVHEAVAEEMLSRLTSELSARPFGDPRAPQAFVGPVISEDAAIRITSWLDEATSRGAEAVVGGTRSGSVVAPTILNNVTPEIRVMRDEVFGPVLLFRVFDDLDGAISEVNDTPYGLAAGIFTGSIATALNAASSLRMGSVHINETSSSRVDLMPYGGVKLSGQGHEGPRYAIREMTEERLISIGKPG